MNRNDNTNKLFSDCVQELYQMCEQYETARYSYFDIDEESYYILQTQQFQCKVIATAISVLIDIQHQELIPSAQPIKVHTIQPLYHLCLETLEKIKSVDKVLIKIGFLTKSLILKEELNFFMILSMVF